jgi:hypothetical protein
MKETTNFKEEKVIYIDKDDFKVILSEDFKNSLLNRNWNDKGINALLDTLNYNIAEILSREIVLREPESEVKF